MRELDAIAARRGRFVHEVLALTPEQLGYERHALRVHRRDTASRSERIAEASGGLFPVPTVAVGG